MPVTRPGSPQLPIGPIHRMADQGAPCGLLKPRQPPPQRDLRRAAQNLLQRGASNGQCPGQIALPTHTESSSYPLAPRQNKKPLRLQETKGAFAVPLLFDDARSAHTTALLRDNGRTRIGLRSFASRTCSRRACSRASAHRSIDSRATFGQPHCEGLTAGDPSSLPARLAYSSRSTSMIAF
jgi:hypothetical protein